MLAFRTELQKIFSTRLWWILLSVGVAISGGMSILIASNVAMSPGAPSSAFSYSYSVAGRVSYLVPLLFGTLIITNEYRYQTLSRTLLLGFSRRAVILSKMAAVAVVAFCAGVGCTAINAAVVFAVVTAGGKDSMLSAPEQLGILWRTPFAFVLWGFVGLGLGLLLRNQIASIISVLGFVLVVEPVLTTLAGESDVLATVGKFLPGAASLSFIWPPDSSLPGSAIQSLPWEQGGAMLALYGVLLIGCGYVFAFRRRDIF